jgi:LmbE family N-acetylglucosaminyl deacetylase
MNQDETTSLPDWLRRGRAFEISAPTIAILVAHPDDEVIGAGAQLARLRNAHFIHVTDGAPLNPYDAITAGFATREDYARARRDELFAALALAGISSQQTRDLGFVDQEASLNFPKLVDALKEALSESKPDVVFTHPYEGGHPDHDATAFAAQIACRLLKHQGITPPALMEMASYHAGGGNLRTNEFLHEGSSGNVATVALSPGECDFKRCLFDCFVTQQRVLCAFPIGFERFRPAPHYDFRQPPHPGPLFYERFDWGMTGARWRCLAREALRALELENAACT